MHHYITLRFFNDFCFMEMFHDEKITKEKVNLKQNNCTAF